MKRISLALGLIVTIYWTLAFLVVVHSPSPLDEEWNNPRWWDITALREPGYWMSEPLYWKFAEYTGQPNDLDPRQPSFVALLIGYAILLGLFSALMAQIVLTWIRIWVHRADRWRPMYRWKSFWTGVLVLTFLALGWLRSLDYVDAIIWASGDGSSEIDLFHSEAKVALWFGGNHVNHKRGIHVDSFRFSEEELISNNVRPASEASDPFSSDEATSSGDLSSKRFLSAASVFQDPDGPTLSIAYWLLVLLFLCLWLHYLIWRRRQMRMLANLRNDPSHQHEAEQVEDANAGHASR